MTDSHKNNKKDGSSRILGIILTVTLVLLAAAAGYIAARGFKNKLSSPEGGGTDITGQNTDDPENGEKAPITSDVISMTPVDLVFELNSETGRIENILVEILRAREGRLDYIRIAPEVSYTMSSRLYGELTPDNTELPQTVTFSELYRYYQNNKAFDAGRRIISELINFNVLYYTSVTDVVLEEVLSIKDTPDGFKAGFVLGTEQARSADYGTEGSVKGLIEKTLDGAVTNWETSQRLRYLDVYDSLGEADVSFHDAPVIEKNESCELDTNGTGAILYGILYK